MKIPSSFSMYLFVENKLRYFASASLFSHNPPSKLDVAGREKKLLANSRESIVRHLTNISTYYNSRFIFQLSLAQFFNFNYISTLFQFMTEQQSTSRIDGNMAMAMDLEVQENTILSMPSLSKERESPMSMEHIFSMLLENQNAQFQTLHQSYDKKFQRIENALDLKRKKDVVKSNSKKRKEKVSDDQRELDDIVNTKSVEEGINDLINENVEEDEDEEEQSQIDQNEETEEQDGDDPVLQNLTREFSEGNFGPAINKQVADIMIQLWGKDLENKILKEKLQKYETPKNLEKLLVPKVNEEIYEGVLKSFERSRDLKYQAIQRYILKAGVAVSQTTDNLLQIKAEIKKMGSAQAITPKINTAIEASFDALALMGHTESQLSACRRSLLRFPIRKRAPKYDRLGRNVPQHSKYLYGDDLGASIKEINATQSLFGYQSKNFQRPQFGTNRFGQSYDQDRYNNRSNYRSGAQHPYTPYRPRPYRGNNRGGRYRGYNN